MPSLGLAIATTSPLDNIFHRRRGARQQSATSIFIIVVVVPKNHIVDVAVLPSTKTPLKFRPTKSMDSNNARAAEKRQRQVDDDVKAEDVKAENNAAPWFRLPDDQLLPEERESLRSEVAKLSQDAAWDICAREVMVDTARTFAMTNDALLRQISNAYRRFTSMEAQKGREGIASLYDEYAVHLHGRPRLRPPEQAELAGIVPLITQDLRGYDEQIRSYHSYPRKREILDRFIMVFNKILSVRYDFGKNLRLILEHGGFGSHFVRALTRVHDDWHKLVLDDYFMIKLGGMASTCRQRGAFDSVSTAVEQLEEFRHAERERKSRLAEQEKKTVLEAAANASIEVFKEIEELRRSLVQAESVEEKARCLEKIADLTSQNSQQWMDLAKEHGSRTA